MTLGTTTRPGPSWIARARRLVYWSQARRDTSGVGWSANSSLRGVALGVWPGGKEPAAALCRLNSDGTLTVVTGVVDMSGTTSAFALIAAETFGLSVDAVDVVGLDTDGAPDRKSVV